MDEIFVEQKAECIVCEEPSHEIRIENRKFDDSGPHLIVYVCCSNCFWNKPEIENAIIKKGLHKPKLPYGLEPKNVKLI